MDKEILQTLKKIVSEWDCQKLVSISLAEKMLFDSALDMLFEMMEQKPVAWRAHCTYIDGRDAGIKYYEDEMTLGEPLYAAPVAPAQTTISPSMAKGIAFKLGAELSDDEAEIFADGWNACSSPAISDSSTQPIIPDGWQMVPFSMTKKMYDAFDELGSASLEELWETLLAAAPAQEASHD